MPMPSHLHWIQAIGTAAQLLGLLSCLAPVLAMHSPSALASETSTQSKSVPQCRNLKLSMTSERTEDALNSAVIKHMSTFEKAVREDDSELFRKVASNALQKKPHELDKIFKGTLFEYDLKKAQLQRNSIWAMQLPADSQPGQLVSCGEIQISPVYGPKSQVAVMYSHFSSNKQTRLLVVFAQTKADADKDENLGLVLMQVQRWSYDGKTPEKIFRQSRFQEEQGEIIISRLLADAAAKILESNPYVMTQLQTEAREKATQLETAATAQLKEFLKPLGLNDTVTPEQLQPIFRENALAVGLKLRMKQELALNSQISLCKAMGRRLFQKESAWRREFSGFECMPYASGEALSQPPKGGSQYFSWSALEAK